MKYLLTSGCSFTKNKRFDSNNLGENKPNRYSWPEYLQKELGSDYKVINLGSATNDNMSIIRILFYYIHKLTEDGVQSKDIIVGTQWSDPHRESFYFKKEISNQELLETPHTLSYVSEKEREGFFFLTGGFAPPDDEMIWQHFEGSDFKNLMSNYSVSILGNNIINSTLHWLESWSHFEMFCESKNIKTFYLTMRNIYSENVYENNFDSHVVDEPNNINWMKNNPLLSHYIPYLPIEKKHYFYKNFGGLYDWTRDNYEKYPDLAPYHECDDSQNWKDDLKLNPDMWGHPSPEMMEIFVKQELKPFLDERILN